MAGQLEVDIPDEPPVTLVCALDEHGELLLVDLPADALADMSSLHGDLRDALMELGVLVPKRWSIG